MCILPGWHTLCAAADWWHYMTLYRAEGVAWRYLILIAPHKLIARDSETVAEIEYGWSAATRLAWPMTSTRHAWKWNLIFRPCGLVSTPRVSSTIEKLPLASISRDAHLFSLKSSGTMRVALAMKEILAYLKWSEATRDKNALPRALWWPKSKFHVNAHANSRREIFRSSFSS